jgi:hypothetical protein
MDERHEIHLEIKRLYSEILNEYEKARIGIGEREYKTLNAIFKQRKRIFEIPKYRDKILPLQELRHELIIKVEGVRTPKTKEELEIEQRKTYNETYLRYRKRI